jgi:RNA polymerase sigma factor (sigma-70 family)
MTHSDEGLASDEQLAQVIRIREQSAFTMRDATDCFEQLYERHSRLLLAFLSSRVSRSDLEDVHQTVWQKIWQYLPGQFKGGNFRAWMHQIARNYLIDLSRKRRPQEMEDTSEPLASGQRPEDPLEDVERQEILTRCLGRLQEDMGEIVRSRLSGEDYNGICTRMGIEPARAHKLFFQAREQVTSCIQKAMQ